MRLPENWDQPAGARLVAERIITGMHGYTRRSLKTFSGLLDDGNGTAVLCDPENGYYRLLLFQRSFLDFPGIAPADMPAIEAEYCEHRPIPETAQFGYSFDRRRSGGYVFWWVIQPDGRYYEDEDGFGAEFQEEIRLFALLDKAGHFITPFRLGEIGVNRYAVPDYL